MKTTFRVQSDGIPIIDRSPVAVLDYTFDWADDTSPWLATGETISSQIVTATAGITIQSATIINSATAVMVQIAGGTIGTVYLVTCQITTSMGRTEERSFRLNVVLR